MLRQESLQQDFVDLEEYFGGSAAPKLFAADQTHYLTGMISWEISTKATQNLCCALKDEIRVYEDLIQRAENFNPTSKQQTIDLAFQKCGFSGRGQMALFCSQ